AAHALAIPDLCARPLRPRHPRAQHRLIARPGPGQWIEARGQQLELADIEPDPAALLAQIDLDPALRWRRLQRRAAARTRPAAPARRPGPPLVRPRRRRRVWQQIGERLCDPGRAGPRLLGGTGTTHELTLQRARSLVVEPPRERFRSSCEIFDGSASTVARPGATIPATPRSRAPSASTSPPAASTRSEERR